MTHIIIGICIITAMIAIIYVTRGGVAKCEQFIVAEKPKPITTRNAWIFYPYRKDARVWADYGSRLQYQPRPPLFEKTYTELSNALTTHGWTLHILDQYTIPHFLEDIPLDLIGENELFIQAAIMYKYGGLWLSAYSYILQPFDDLYNSNSGITIPLLDEVSIVLPLLSKPHLPVWRQFFDYIIKNPSFRGDFDEYVEYRRLLFSGKNNYIRCVDPRVFGLMNHRGEQITFLNYNMEISPVSVFVNIDRKEEERRETAYMIHHT
jgi:hypothetical protein